jgi:hypothetical protein
MTDIWNFPSADWTSGRDLVGYDVEATDGSIGKIDESTVVAGRQHIVVDTGFWIFGKKRLIPAGTVKQIDHTNEKVFVSLTKEQIKDAPDFDETRRNDDDYRSDHERYYDPYRARV